MKTTMTTERKVTAIRTITAMTMGEKGDGDQNDESNNNSKKGDAIRTMTGTTMAKKVTAIIMRRVMTMGEKGDGKGQQQ